MNEQRQFYQPIKITARGSTVRRDFATGMAQVEVTNPEDMNDLTRMLNAARVKWTTERRKPSARTYAGTHYRYEVKAALYVTFNYDELAGKLHKFIE